MAPNGVYKTLALVSLAVLAYLFATVSTNSQDKTLRPGAECINQTAHEATRDGFRLSDKGQHERALGSYLRAVSLEPTCAATYHNLGNGYYRLERHEEAIQAYRQALRFNPSWAWVIHNGIARSLSLLNRTDDSIKAYSEAIRLNPKDELLLRHRQNLYLKIGRWDAAAADGRIFLQMKGLKDKTSLYVALFTYLGYRKSRQEDSARVFLEEVSKSKVSEWPFPVVKYFRREIGEQELIAKADDDVKMAEARSYIGLDLLMSGRLAEATPHLNWVKENGRKTLVEYKLVIAELERLSKNTTN